MADFYGFGTDRARDEMRKDNGVLWNPAVDLNLQREPRRTFHIFSTSPRSYTIDRAPLFRKLHLRECPKGERYVEVTTIPDPLMQAVLDTERGEQLGKANDGFLVTIDLLDPIGQSKGCNLLAQGLFYSLNETPTEGEIAEAEAQRNERWRRLIQHADSLEQTNRAELEELLRGEDGVDLRHALDFYGEQRGYYKPMIATRSCPHCGEAIKLGVGFHKSTALDGALCVIDWKKAVAAGVKKRSDVPDEARWWSRKTSAEGPASAEGSDSDSIEA